MINRSAHAIIHGLAAAQMIPNTRATYESLTAMSRIRMWSIAWSDVESPDTALADAGAFATVAGFLTAGGDRQGRLLTEIVDMAVYRASLNAPRRLERTVGDATIFQKLWCYVPFPHFLLPPWPMVTGTICRAGGKAS